MVFAQKSNYFRQCEVIACSFTSSLWCLCLCLWFLCFFLSIGESLYRKRIPLFGDREINYGPPQYPPIYPLFMRDKPYHYVSPKKLAKKRKRTTIVCVVWISTFVLSIFMLIPAVFARQCLYTDGSISTYNMFNSQTCNYRINDIESVHLDVSTLTSKQNRYRQYHVEMVIKTDDGEEYVFNEFSFDDVDCDNGYSDQYANMLRIKELYGQLVTIKGIDLLPKVIKTQELSADEIALLYQLFEVVQ